MELDGAYLDGPALPKAWSPDEGCSALLIVRFFALLLRAIGSCGALSCRGVAAAWRAAESMARHSLL